MLAGDFLFKCSASALIDCNDVVLIVFLNIEFKNREKVIKLCIEIHNLS